MKNGQTLLDVCSLIVDCEHKTAPTQEEGYPSICTPNIGRGYFILEGVNRVSDETYRLWTRRAIPQYGDLIMAREAPVGNVAMVPHGLQPCLGQRTLLLRPDQSKVHPRYLSYLLVGDEIQGLIYGMTNGATVPHLNMKDVRSLPLPPLPHLTVQRKIASILSAYDYLIENNTRRIAILEAMAKAIYREWFVEFRFPGYEKVKLVNSPLGKVPEAWKPQTVGSVLDFHIGGGWGQDTADEEYSNPAFVIRGTDIPNARALRVVDCPLRYHTDSNIRSRKLRANDLVFEVSGGSKGQPVGRCLFVSERLLRRFDGDVICASFCKLIRANPSLLAPEILYHYLLDCYGNGVIEQYEVQSTGIKNFKFTVFLDSESLLVPPPDVQESFVEKVRPTLDEVHVLGKKNENLRSTRDLLLPKLISGQLNVEDLDIDIGEGETE
jgi:type I restriction enzyme, S subunit